MWPTARSGWLALGAALVGLGSWIVLPVITTLFRDEYPVTDTAAMPVVGVVLVTLAAIINVLTVWLGRHDPS
jgi:MFS family permease